MKSLIVALEAYLHRARSIGLEIQRTFPDLLVDLISNRPGVLAETMSSFTELRSLVVRVVRGEFILSVKADPRVASASEMVDLKIRTTPTLDLGAVRVPLALLLSTCVLLSIWQDADDNESVDELVDALMRTSVDDDEDIGLGCATLAESKLPALSVESVRSSRLNCKSSKSERRSYPCRSG